MDCCYGSTTGSCVDTVRALRQTIASLRNALEESRGEISDLKSKKDSPIEGHRVRSLSIENHLLREELIYGKKKLSTSKTVSFSNIVDGEKRVSCSNNLDPRKGDKGKVLKLKNLEELDDKVVEKKKEKQVVLNEGEKNRKDRNCKGSKKRIEFSVKVSKKKPSKNINIDIQTKYKKTKKSVQKMEEKKPEEPEKIEKTEPVVPPLELNKLTDQTNTTINDIDQEVDDIELIFTTDDTKETDFKEELVPIDSLLRCPLSDYEEKLSGDASDRELEDDVFNAFQDEEKSPKSYYSFRDASFESKSLEKDESFDRFEEKAAPGGGGIVETDISKIGIQDAQEFGNCGRRNTCPNPVQYRPIAHREALGRAAGRKGRPLLAHAGAAARKDSEAQTRITAVPGSAWRSESSLAHKVKIGDNFTTLPSKFPHPASRLQLSEKTVEARRVLLSDIGFTSMVPELSRSADHLFPPTAATTRTPTQPAYGQFLRTTDLYSPAYAQTQKYLWTPSERSASQSRYSSQFVASPPAPARRCSAPVSPSRKPARAAAAGARARFANGSLPELRADWTAGDSGDSTDSLVEEAEHYLRRSIDCLAPCHNVRFKKDASRSTRRASAPEPCRDNAPPPGWQPFLPRAARDLRPDYWAKAIAAEGRVRGGRVRYVGPLAGQPETHVGVQLSTPDGQSDGTYNGRRYFNCEPYHGLFIPFKKIIMGWRP